MARKDLFEEDDTLEFPELTFKSNVRPKPGLGLSNGPHRDEGRLLTLTRNGDNFIATYEGELTIDGQKYKWESEENSKVDGDGNITGKETVTFKPRTPPGLRQKIKMDTKWEKRTNKVTNTGYEE